MPPTIPPTCRHLKTDGRRCGSPALRGKPLCFQHDTLRRPIPVKKIDGQTVPQLPAPVDFLAIQRGISEIIRLLADDELTDRRAATLLRGFALASQNLARTLRHEEREQRRQTEANADGPVTDLVNHPELGSLALEDTASDTSTPIQENQDLSPQSEKITAVLSWPADLRDPAPTPQPLFTPSSETTAADDYRVGQLYMELQESFLDKRHAFEAEKTAELEAKFQSRLDRELESRLAAALDEAQQTHLEAQIRHYLTEQQDLHPSVS